jgi:hypothetical protein
MALTEAQALAKLKLLVAWTTDPALTAAEVQGLLDDALRVTEWATATEYAVGARIVTSDRNGRVYVCRDPGTSGATEPDWGETSGHYLGRAVDDGDDLVWVDAGPAFAELWDLRAAAQAGWLLKASRATDRFYFASSGQMFSRQQVIDNCLRMAGKYEPLFVA